jgi:hypothetical protein
MSRDDGSAIHLMLLCGTFGGMSRTVDGVDNSIHLRKIPESRGGGKLLGSYSIDKIEYSCTNFRPSVTVLLRQITSDTCGGLMIRPLKSP